MTQENLNKENFWNEMHQKYPLAMKDFCEWIDKYKESIKWKSLFNDHFKRGEIKGKGWGETEISFLHPKFHDLPLALQMGIWREYLDEHDFPRCKNEIENYLHAAEEGVHDVAERLFDDEDFQTCDNCDLPDACSDFGCAIRAGIKKNISIN